MCIRDSVKFREVFQSVNIRLKDFPELDENIRDLALKRFWEFHNYELTKTPSTAELLVWLTILNAKGVTASELEQPLHQLPALGALIKDAGDIERLR